MTLWMSVLLCVCWKEKLLSCWMPFSSMSQLQEVKHQHFKEANLFVFNFSVTKNTKWFNVLNGIDSDIITLIAMEEKPPNWQKEKVVANSNLTNRDGAALNSTLATDSLTITTQLTNQIQKVPRSNAKRNVVWLVISLRILYICMGFIFRKLKDACNPQCLQPAVKHGGGSAMLWAATVITPSVGYCHITAK